MPKVLAVIPARGGSKGLPRKNILPLFGKKTYDGSRHWNYYTVSNNNVKIPLTVQNAWMLDDFTENNGATRVIPKSHLFRKKPGWGYDSEQDEIILTGPAGSMAMWLSQTWHRSGPNLTDNPRRALLGYFSRSWIKPFSDYTRAVPKEVMETYTPSARYLMGWSAFGPKRG